MLLNDFYTAQNIQEADGSITGSIAFNAAHAIFEGHFPGQPVVPGVCMMQIVKELLEQTIGQDTRLKQAAFVKFLSVIVPDQHPVVQVKLVYQRKEDAIDVQAELYEGKLVFFKFKGSFAVAL